VKVNMFEGARRIALVLGVLWVGGCIAYGILAEPQADLDYSINRLGAVPVRVERCGADDGREYLSTDDGKGNSVSVTLCFKAFPSDKGERLIPYAPAENGKWWMAGPYSSEVTRYMKERGESFALPPQGMEEARRLRWGKRLEQWKDAAVAAVSGLAVGWALVLVVGWVVRGFLGIARGQDARAAN
jgi:hypothetical protein